MKIGMSFGRCLRDVVEERVLLNDVTVIIAQTACEDEERLLGVVEHYHDYGMLRHLDLDLCKIVATNLYRTGRIHQPRLFGAVSKVATIGLHWYEVPALPAHIPDASSVYDSDNPMLQTAWENWQLALKLASS